MTVHIQTFDEMLQFGAGRYEALKACEVFRMLRPGLRINRNGMVETTHGMKNPLGLYRTVKDEVKAEMPEPTEDKHAAARQQARAQLDSIVSMVAALECDYNRLAELKDERESLQRDVDNAEDEDRTEAAAALAEWDEENAEELKELTDAAGDCENEDDARQRIEEDALSVDVRSDWYSPGNTEDSKPSEYKILLCTGGPACQIIGDLDHYGQPESATIQFQDWFTSWENLTELTSEEEDAVLTYCRVFYFGE